MTYVRNDEVDADAVKYVLNLVKNYSFEIEPLLADSGFYNERVIRHSREISPTIIQVPKKVERIKEELGVHKSCMTIYRMYKDPERDYVSRSLSLSPTKTVIYVLLNPQKTSDRVALYYVQKHC